jgi:hypothetical protein
MVELPSHYPFFTNISEKITLPGFDCQERWFDPWALKDPMEMEDWELQQRYERNQAYEAYLKSFNLGKKNFQWQVIRVHNRNHAYVDKSDWWQDYRDCAFRVWMQPCTMYSQYVKDHIQYYILSPEDIYLTHCFERHKRGLSYPARKTFKWISPHKELRKMRLIPVEVCKHFRHETTAGKLPEGNEFNTDGTLQA